MSLGECLKFGGLFRIGTPPKFSSSPLKNDGWEVVLSFEDPRSLKLQVSRFPLFIEG